MLGLLLLAITSVAPATTLLAGDKPAAPPGGLCPLTSEEVKAALVQSSYKGHPNAPLKIGLHMTPTEPPAGYYYTTLVDVLSSPPGAEPEVLPGVPEIMIKCMQAGRYLVRVRVNLIAKSSCGGVKAKMLLDEKVHLNIN
jgi:hypothetical protein